MNTEPLQYLNEFESIYIWGVLEVFGENQKFYILDGYKAKNMKISSLAAILVLSLVMLASCSKDEPTPADKLVGKWSSGTVSINMKVGDMTLNQYLVSTGVSAAEALLYTALINSTMQSYFTGELLINADKTFTWKTTSSTTSVSGTWSVDNDGGLTLNSPTGLGGVFDIMELSPAKLNLHSLQNVDPALMGNALTSTVTVDITLSFTRD